MEDDDESRSLPKSFAEEQSEQGKQQALGETQRWIEAVTGQQFEHPTDFRRSLANGILLCDLLNILKPKSVRKVNRTSMAIAGLDNLSIFLSTCEQTFGVSRNHLFEPEDLEDLSQRALDERALQAESDKRLLKVAVGLFWLAKSIEAWYEGSRLDTSAFALIIHDHERSSNGSSSGFRGSRTSVGSSTSTSTPVPNALQFVKVNSSQLAQRASAILDQVEQQKSKLQESGGSMEEDAWQNSLDSWKEKRRRRSLAASRMQSEEQEEQERLQKQREEEAKNNIRQLRMRRSGQTSLIYPKSDDEEAANGSGNEHQNQQPANSRNQKEDAGSNSASRVSVSFRAADTCDGQQAEPKVRLRETRNSSPNKEEKRPATNGHFAVASPKSSTSANEEVIARSVASPAQTAPATQVKDDTNQSEHIPTPKMDLLTVPSKSSSRELTIRVTRRAGVGSGERSWGICLAGGGPDDQPVIIDRVKMGSSADICELCRGDHLVAINERRLDEETGTPLEEIRELLTSLANNPGYADLRVCRFRNGEGENEDDLSDFSDFEAHEELQKERLKRSRCFSDSSISEADPVSSPQPRLTAPASPPPSPPANRISPPKQPIESSDESASSPRLSAVQMRNQYFGLGQSAEEVTLRRPSPSSNRSSLDTSSTPAPWQQETPQYRPLKERASLVAAPRLSDGGSMPISVRTQSLDVRLMSGANDPSPVPIIDHTIAAQGQLQQMTSPPRLPSPRNSAATQPKVASTSITLNISPQPQSKSSPPVHIVTQVSPSLVASTGTERDQGVNEEDRCPKVVAKVNNHQQQQRPLANTTTAAAWTNPPLSTAVPAKQQAPIAATPTPPSQRQTAAPLTKSEVDQPPLAPATVSLVSAPKQSSPPAPPVSSSVPARPQQHQVRMENKTARQRSLQEPAVPAASGQQNKPELSSTSNQDVTVSAGPTPRPQQQRTASLPRSPTDSSVKTTQQQSKLNVNPKKMCASCNQELGTGDLMVIESLQLYYHLSCFRCTVCGLTLGNGQTDADVRIRRTGLHCADCYAAYHQHRQRQQRSGDSNQQEDQGVGQVTRQFLGAF